VIGYEPEKVTYDYAYVREPRTRFPEDLGPIDAPTTAAPRRLAADLQPQSASENEATAELNERIHAVLVKATRVNPMQGGLPAANDHTAVDPRRWWDWWRTQSQSNCYISAGIDVWTQTGLRPIEQILPGDRVLTRDPASRELTFNLVNAVDEQPEGPMLAIEFDSRTIVAAPEQLFHVTSVGWKPTVDLQAGMQLDGLAGTHRIDGVGPSHAVARYSLLVANVASYFVDQQGILVHDAARP
jgi:hypothetical protein